MCREVAETRLRVTGEILWEVGRGQIYQALGLKSYLKRPFLRESFPDIPLYSTGTVFPSQRPVDLLFSMFHISKLT